RCWWRERVAWAAGTRSDGRCGAPHPVHGPARVRADRAGAAMIRVLLADDQSLVRGAVAALLGLEEDIEVAGEAGSGAEVLDLLRSAEVDVALVDVEMPGMDGIAL